MTRDPQQDADPGDPARGRAEVTCRGDTRGLEVVTVWKRKRPLGSGRWCGYALGADAHGTWVYTPAHSTYLGDDGRGGGGRCEVAQDSQGVGRHSLVLLPVAGWFVAHWVLEADHVVSVDISTPPRRSGQRWAFDDLELDPFLLPDGTFGVDDEDEFAQACYARLITDQERMAAKRAVTWLHHQLTMQSSPLVATGLRRLGDAVRLHLPPLTSGVDA